MMRVAGKCTYYIGVCGRAHLICHIYEFNSQLCYVEGEKEKERMMQNEDKTRFFIIFVWRWFFI